MVNDDNPQASDSQGARDVPLDENQENDMNFSDNGDFDDNDFINLTQQFQETTKMKDGIEIGVYTGPYKGYHFLENTSGEYRIEVGEAQALEEYHGEIPFFATFSFKIRTTRSGRWATNVTVVTAR
jgi:hypothetical protein